MWRITLKTLQIFGNNTLEKGEIDAEQDIFEDSHNPKHTQGPLHAKKV